MAGYLAYAEMDRYGNVSGRTHGCACCSKSLDPVTIDDLDRHLKELQEEMDKITELKAKMLQVQEIAKQ